MLEIKTKFPINQVASFDVDAQNTFTELCPLELPVKGGQDIVPELNAQAKYARYRVGSKDAHSPASLWVDTDREPQFTPIADALNMDVRWKIHGVPGSAGFRLIDGLPAVKDYDFFVWKGIELDMHPYSACYHDLTGKASTGVIEWLQSKGVTTIIVGGLAWEFCVLKTVMDLKKAGFEVILNSGATRGISEEGVTKATEAMIGMGVHIVQKASELSLIIS